MTIEERVQRAAEQLLGDESLTGEMDDLGAQTLLDWGIGLSRQLCQQTDGMDDTQAEEYLSDTLSNLRRVIRRVNKLIDQLPHAEAEMIAGRLAGIFESAASVPGLVAASPIDLGTLSGNLAQLPPADALAQLLSLLKPEVIDGP